MTGPRHHRSSVRGFSLLELVVVMVLIGLMTALLARGLGIGSEGRQLRQAADTVAEQLRFARVRALASGESQRFVLQADSRRWQGADGRSGQLMGDISVRAVTAKLEQLGPQDAAVRFFPDGASTGGFIELRSGEAVRRVEVDWLLGGVQVRAVSADGSNLGAPDVNGTASSP